MAIQEEMFDIFDAQMNRVGSAPRSEVHAKGYWHQTFQCWIIRGEAENRTLLLQERHPDKDSFPGYLDISCAGHLAAGESVKVSVHKCKQLLAGNETAISVQGVRTGSDGNLEEHERTVVLSDIVPHDAEYFYLLFRAIANI